MDRQKQTKKGRSKQAVNSKGMLYKCQAKCDFKGRRDNLQTHYLKAYFDENGDALSPSHAQVAHQTGNKKELYILHTTYLYEQGISRNGIYEKGNARLYSKPVAKCLSTGNRRDMPITSYITASASTATGSHIIVNEVPENVSTAPGCSSLPRTTGGVSVPLADTGSASIDNEVSENVIMEPDCSALPQTTGDVSVPLATSSGTENNIDATIGKITLQLTEISKQLQHLTAISNQAQASGDVICSATELAAVKNTMNTLIQQLDSKTKKNICDTKFLDSEWKETTDEVICVTCQDNKNDSKMPRKLKSSLSGSFGVLKRHQTNYNLKTAIKRHRETTAHQWCNENAKKMKTCLSKDKEAARKIVLNILFCLLNSESAETYVKLCDKDELTSNSQWATKNDGRQMFFEVRDLVYEELKKHISKLIEGTDFVSVTLDKVTVCGESYTVIVTYLFHAGKIHWFLNELHFMKSDELDGIGCARMLVRTLMASLNLTNAELGKKLRHIVYDGVYADKGERIHGGGTLNLVPRVEELLSLPVGTITGCWDAGHKMQLSIADVFLKDTQYKLCVQEMYRAMGLFKDQRAGMTFLEKAEELHHPILSNKSVPQSTRWVRSDIRAFETYFRNAPTIYAIIGDNIKQNADDVDLTKQKENEQKLKILKDAKTWVYYIGFVQILELYAATSLKVQGARIFGTTVFEECERTVDALDRLGANWQWNDKPFVYCCAGTATTLIKNLKEGVYRPTVTDAALARRQKMLSVSARYNQGVADALDKLGDKEKEKIVDFTIIDAESDDTVNLPAHLAAGDIPILPPPNFNTVVIEVQAHLSKLCRDLSTAWKLRLEATRCHKPVMKAASELFHICNLKSFNHNVPSSFHAQLEEIREKLKAVLDKLPTSVKEMYENDRENIAQGCLQWALHCNYEIMKNTKVTYEDLYTSFVEKNDMSQSAHGTAFRNLFEYVEVKSFSEAICETIGSIMKIARGKGRNLEPTNFHKEIFCRVNLPPLHICRDRIVPTIADIILEKPAGGPRRFYRVLDEATQSLAKKLKHKNLSVSLSNHRELMEKKNNLPIDLFQ